MRIHEQMGVSRHDLKAFRAEDARMDELCSDLDRVQTALRTQANAAGNSQDFVDLDLVRLESDLTHEILAHAPVKPSKPDT